MLHQIIPVALVLVLATPFCARGEDKPPAVPFDDAAFIKMVAVGGMYEVYLSNLAGPETRNTDVKDLAAGVVASHLVASKELKTTATEAGIELPTKLDDAHQKRYEAFKDHKGTDLDREYAKAMVLRLTIGVEVFSRASKEAKNPAVKEFASKTLPTLQKHLEMAKKLDK